MHFFLTGHTGFKGSWFTLMLKELGHEVSGLSLQPVQGGLFERAEIHKLLSNHFISDVRDQESLFEAINKSSPDIAIHLAAQPLVLESYNNPIETFTTNVDGTRNFLQAITLSDEIQTSLVVTTDKVYRDNVVGNYREDSALGGKDPYSASKAMADILTQSWAATHNELKVKVARAGNVIGGFDVSENRLVPDIIRASLSGQALVVRNPNSVRPWQHVLDCLYGYYLLVEQSCSQRTLPVAFNFGPDASSMRTVMEVVSKAGLYVEKLQIAESLPCDQGLEASTLTLDSSLAKHLLGWKNRIGFDEAIEMSLESLKTPTSPLMLTLKQVKWFLETRSR